MLPASRSVNATRRAGKGEGTGVGGGGAGAGAVMGADATLAPQPASGRDSASSRRRQRPGRGTRGLPVTVWAIVARRQAAKALRAPREPLVQPLKLLVGVIVDNDPAAAARVVELDLRHQGGAQLALERRQLGRRRPRRRLHP